MVEDILQLLDQGVEEPNEQLVEELGRSIAQTVAARLQEPRREREPSLRISNLGKGDRQIWYELKGKGDKEPLEPEARIKFLFGDIWESIMLYLAKEAGHEVTHEQATVEVNGVVGHNDAIIDGVVVDVKTASKFSFQKFKSGKLREDDPFGYMEQLSGYSKAHGGLDGAFLVVEKERGNLTLLKVDAEELANLNIEDRIDHLREVLASDEEPERCYEPVEHGKSGNLALGVNCSYCPFKFHCWRDANDGMGLRTFIYSDGPKRLVHVEKEPQVLEVSF